MSRAPATARIASLAMRATLLLAVASCDEPLSPDQSSSVAPPQAALASDTVAAPERDEGPDLVAVDRFGLSLEVVGNPRVGERVVLRTTLIGHLPAREVEIRLDLPDIAGVPATGSRVRSRETWRTAVVPGMRRTFTTPVVFPAPGYYRVAVTARTTSGESSVGTGRFVQDAAAAEVFVLIGEHGGSVTPEFDPARVPQGMKEQSGRFQPINGDIGAMLVPRDCDPTVDPSCSPPSEPGDVEVVARYLYDGTFIPLERARVTIGSRSALTDASGYAYITGGCPAAGRTATINVRTDNDSVGVVRVSGTSRLSSVASRTINDQQCYTTLTIDASGEMPNKQSRFFWQLQRTLRGTRAFFGPVVNRSKIMARLQETNTGQATHEWYGSAYQDTIRVDRNVVLGPLGAYTSAHEYGHAVHQRALGGIVGSKCYVPPSGVRLIDGPNTMGCAYREGFASYVAAAVRGDEGSLWPSDTLGTAGSFGSMIEENSLAGAEPDGSKVEGAVAAFLYDVSDPENEPPFDQVAYPGSYVANVVKYCEVTISFKYVRRASGIDDIIYCMERRIGVKPSTTYFTKRIEPAGTFPQGADRRSTPTGVRSYAGTRYPLPAGYNADRIRALWKCDLYQEGCVSAPSPDLVGPPAEEPIAPDSPLAGVTIDGPDPVQPFASCTWFAVPQGGTAPFTYAWTADGSPAGDGSSQLMYANGGGPYLSLEVTVTDATGATSSTARTITVSSSAGACLQ